MFPWHLWTHRWTPLSLECGSQPQAGGPGHYWSSCSWSLSIHPGPILIWKCLLLPAVCQQALAFLHLAGISNPAKDPIPRTKASLQDSRRRFLCVGSAGLICQYLLFKGLWHFPDFPAGKQHLIPLKACSISPPHSHTSPQKTWNSQRTIM